MQSNNEKMVEFLFLNKSLRERRAEFQKNKIAPKEENYRMLSTQEYENEWQQEYYIIYNSYVLDPS